ncbi:sensor histidine kinase [Flindersiella endophytica]
MNDPWQQRLDRMRRFLPIPLLGVSAIGSFAMPGHSVASRPVEALLVLAAAGSSLALGAWSRPTASTPRRVLLYCVHMAITAVLVWVNLWYGVFAYAGFLFAYPLGRRWRTAGFGVNALIVSASLVGGYPSGSLGESVPYFVVAAIMMALVLNTASISNHALEQNEERGLVIRELAETNRRLAASMAENERLQERLLVQAREAGVVDERQRLAGEIHDTLAQGLTAIVAQLQAAERARHRPAEWSRHLELAETLARSSLTEARRSVRALRPEQLEGASLPEAVEELARTWSQRSGVTAELETTGTAVRTGADIEAAVFRAAQEALTNIAKHAGAGQVRLTLTYLDDTLLLDVADDGEGFDPEASTEGYGLAGMRHRLASVGGRLTVESAPGYGTTLNAAVPLRVDQPGEAP